MSTRMRTTLAVLALTAALPVLAAEQTISWEEADKHVGEEATVEGRVVDVHCSQLSCLLAFEPSFNRFTAVVQARDFGNFPPEELQRRYRGKLVSVHGAIKERDGKPEIVLEKPDDIALAGKTPRSERSAETAARSQAEVLDRLADVLER